MEFKKRKAKGFPNEYQLVTYTKHLFTKQGYHIIDHNRLKGGFDLIVSKDSKTLGIEIKSLLDMHELQRGIGQCIINLRECGIDSALLLSNFKREDKKRIENYLKSFNLPIVIDSIEEIEGKPYLITDPLELENWQKVG